MSLFSNTPYFLICFRFLQSCNKNKSIAAKSMYNMALACEMSGNMDAAIDWAEKSFYVFGTKNGIHSTNCSDYIRILGQRKLDIKKIESEPDVK